MCANDKSQFQRGCLSTSSLLSVAHVQLYPSMSYTRSAQAIRMHYARPRCAADIKRITCVMGNRIIVITMWKGPLGEALV